MMLHHRGFFSPPPWQPRGAGLCSPPPPTSAPSEVALEMAANRRDALGFSRKPAKLHSMNAVWKNLFTMMHSCSWKHGAAISSTLSCKCKEASQNAFQTQK